MDKNGLPWEENDYVKMNICVQINGLKMQQFWTDSLDDPVAQQRNVPHSGTGAIVNLNHKNILRLDLHAVFKPL